MSDSQEPTVIVNTLNGAVRGKVIKTCLGDEINIFHKIPYMQPPVGKLRFKNPQPIQNWEGVLDGTIEGPVFAQFNHQTNKIVGQEDALHINAYSKNLNPDKLSPVMVFIHGGAFAVGSPNREDYSPDFLLQKDIVYFSMTYRLGCLGFLSLDEPELEIPGNAALKDQTMALKWIKNNADVFGGDSNNITLFGQSAGGAAVHYHLLSDFSKGLFQKAIVQSGSAISEWALQPKKRYDYSLLLLKAFGWNENKSMAETLDRLQDATLKELIDAQPSPLMNDDSKVNFMITWAPSIEPYISDQCFLLKSPLELIKNPWSNDIPLIIGGTSEEGLLYIPFNPALTTAECYENEDLYSNLFHMHSDIEEKSLESKKFGDAVKQVYYGEEKPTFENREKFIHLLTDKMFWYGMHETIKYRVNNPNNPAPIYGFRFAFDNDFCNIKVMKGVTEKGVAHSGEIPFLFKNFVFERFGGLPEGTPQFEMVKKMVGMWTHFAIYGNPNCPEIESDIWKPIASKVPPFKVLNILDELSYIDLPETTRLEGLHHVYSER